MRLLLTHPFFWPHVRRGAEREVHDVGARLVERGHRVDLVTGQPDGVLSRRDVDGVRVTYVRTPLPGALARRGVTRELAFGPVAAAGAALSQADAVISYLYADGWGASLSRRLHGRRPVVLKLTGAVPRWWLDAHGTRVDRAVLRRALDAADEVWVNSQYAVDAMADWGRPMHVVPAGVDERTFAPGGARDGEPLVLCSAAPEEPRKRLVDLLDAWQHVRDALPSARLLVAGEAGAGTRSRLLDRLRPTDRESVAFAGRLDDAALVAAYRRAWVTVVPSVHEALGLVTLESLACGTPVAGADSGATPELLRSPGTGTLFAAGDPQELAAAVVRTVGLAQSPATREVCRAAALDHAWPRIIDQVERRMTRLLP